MTSDGEHKPINTKKKLWGLQPILEQTRKVTAVCMCEFINLEKAKTIFTGAYKHSTVGEVLIVQNTLEEKFIIIFEFGVIVLWNEKEETELNFLTKLQMCSAFENELSTELWTKDTLRY
jgi:uncharacterized Rmd1/YagE family protein